MPTALSVRDNDSMTSSSRGHTMVEDSRVTASNKEAHCIWMIAFCLTAPFVAGVSILRRSNLGHFFVAVCTKEIRQRIWRNVERIG